MYNETQSTQITAYTMIENQTVVNMYAQKSTKGDINMNINIQSPTLYEAHKEECDADIETFKSHVEEL
ncbi:MAG: hypothetical protein J6M44_01705 [Butyrivibrio sp.]|nr:hypothetical protein [Butyrivibrio sp.]